MTTHNRLRAVLHGVVFMLLLSWQAHAADGERVEYDAQTGNYIVYYYSYTAPGVLQRVVVVPTNKIDPTVYSNFTVIKDGAIQYRYKINSGANSRQPLTALRYEANGVDPMSQEIPRDWEGLVVPNPVPGQPAFRVNWTYRDLRTDGTAGLLPGRTQGGFGIKSSNLPGIAMVRFSGAAPVLGPGPGFPDEGPSPESAVGRQLYSIERGVRRSAAIPRIPNPSPFDAAVVLSGIQKHLNQDLVPMKLVDPVLASQLDRLLSAAADAARLGNSKGAGENLKDFRKLLKREYDDLEAEEDFDKDDDKGKKKSALIDRLAARVLDFDAKYVLKRLDAQD